MTVPLPLFAGTLLALAIPAPAPRLQEGTADTSPRKSAFEATDPAGKLHVRVHESIIGFSDSSLNDDSYVPGPDGKRFAYSVMDAGGVAVVVDGNKGERFEGFAIGSLKFSPGATRVGYVGTRPGKQIAVVDGKSFEYDGVTKDGITFSPKGERVAWVAARNKKQIAVVDEVEGPPYDGVLPPGVLFSPDGKHYAYSAFSAGKHLVVCDGEEGPLFDRLAGLKFTSQGQHLTYTAMRGQDWFAVVDQNPTGPFVEMKPIGGRNKEAQQLGGVVNESADGAHLTLAGRRGDEWFVFVDGKERGPYKGCTGATFSNNGSRVAYLATRGEGWFLVVDQEEIHGQAIQGCTFSPDGKVLSMILKRDEKQVAKIGDQEGKPYDRIEEPGVFFSEDGKRTAYLASTGAEKVVVIDGGEGAPFKQLGKIGIGFAPLGAHVFYSIRHGERESLVVDGVAGPTCRLRSLTFSKDGQRYAYAAEKDENRWTVVIDGVEYGPHGKLEPGTDDAFHMLGKGTPVFSPDGKHVAYTGVSEKGTVVYVDGKPGRPYDLVMRGSVDFSPDGQHVAFIGMRGEKRFIVLDDLEIDNGWTGFMQPGQFVFDGPNRFFVRGARLPRYLLIEVEIL